METCLDCVAPQYCICYTPEESEICVCLDTERALRAYIYGHPMPAMTAEQREWCLEEIDRVEGFDRTDYEQSTVADVARGVLDSWICFARDKGLL